MFHALFLALLVNGRHDFDFQFGTWKVHVLRLVHPLSGSKTWVAYDGTHVVSKVWSGRANIGVLEIDGPAGHIEGQSLRLYNPQSHQWSFTFAQSSLGLMGPPMIGEFHNGRGEFYNQDSFNGRSIFVRSITSDVTPTSYRDEYAFSADGGKTWETNWVATFTLANAASVPEPSPPGGADAQQHGFDFEFGAWRMHLKRLQHPLTHSHTWVSYDGPSVVRKIWNGRSNLGEIDIAGPAGHIEGLSLRLYDPQSHQWNISFANADHGMLGVPTIGEFKDGRGEFFDRETYDGRAIFVRYIFSGMTLHSFRYEQAFSPDGGKTWETNWIADFTRV